MESSRKSTRQYSKCLVAPNNPKSHSTMQLVIDKQGKKKNNQTYAASLCGGANSGGNHSDMDLIQTISNASEREHGFKNVSPALLSRDYKDPKLVKTKVADYRIDEGLRIRKDNIAPTLTSSKNSETQVSSMSPFVWEDVQPVRALTETRTDEAKEIRKVMRKNGKDFSPRRMKYLKERDDYLMNALTTSQTKESLIKTTSNIRRLTPVECMRLQGFPDNWNEHGIIDGQVVKISDTQRYKQAGNAVTVNVVEAVARKLKP